MTAQEVTAWVGTRTVARQAREQARAERRECRQEVARVCEVLVLRDTSEAREDIRHYWARRFEAALLKSRPSDARNEGWWVERKTGATYTSIAKREKISVTTVTVGVWRIQCRKLWAWRHPTDETVIRGRTMLDDEDAGARV